MSSPHCPLPMVAANNITAEIPTYTVCSPYINLGITQSLRFHHYHLRI